MCLFADHANSDSILVEILQNELYPPVRRGAIYVLFYSHRQYQQQLQCIVHAVHIAPVFNGIRVLLL